MDGGRAEVEVGAADGGEEGGEGAEVGSLRLRLAGNGWLSSGEDVQLVLPAWSRCHHLR